MKIPRLFSTVIVLIIFFLVPPKANAIEMRGGESPRVEKDQVIYGSLVIGGNSVTVDGNVRGDVFCGGQTIVISGNVEGDVICGAQTLNITGTVGGDVRYAGQLLDVSGSVGRNVTAVGQTISISQDATITGEILFGAQNFHSAGVILKSVTGAGQNTSIDGVVEGDVNLEVESLRLGDKAAITGKLSYTSNNQATIDPTATVSGAIVRQEPKENDEQDKSDRKVIKSNKPWPANTIGAIVLHIVTGSILVALFPQYIRRTQKLMLDAPVITGLKGAAVLFLAPVVILSLCLTIIGIPAAILAVVLYALVLSLSRLFVATVVGRMLIDQFAEKRADNLYYQVLVGVPVLWLFLKAPLVGGILTFLAILWGTGGLLLALRKVKK